MSRADAETTESQIEIGDDDVSSYGDSTSDGSYATSLSSSVFNFVYENGRRYTSQRSTSTSEYMIPNDEVEQSRLDLAHHLWGLLFGGVLHKAKLDVKLMEKRAKSGDPFRVLDLGTGTGIWAIDFGDTYPAAEVLGIDLSPIQPDWVPPNVKFLVDNFEDEWVYTHKFDFIHTRNIIGGIKNYPKLFENIYNNLVPGTGIVEIHESDITGCYSEDDTLKPDSAIAEYNRILDQAGRAMGQRMDTAPEFKSYLETAGFIDVSESIGKCAIGPWPKNKEHKEIGLVTQEILQTGIEAYGLAALTRVLGWETTKAKEFCDRVVVEVNNRKIHKIYPFYTLYATRPHDKVSDGKKVVK